MKNNLNRPFLVVLMLTTYQRAITQHFTMDEKTKLTASDLLTRWQKNTIEALLECLDVTAIRAKLNRMKAEYIIKRYGTVENCKRIGPLLGLNGRFVTILGTIGSECNILKTSQYST